MPDPLSQLALPVGPQPPLPSPVAVAWPGGPIVVLVALLLLAGALAGILWWRGRWRRGLVRVARAAQSTQAADLLAALARRHRVQAPAAWWQALDRARFGPPGSSKPEAVQRLLAEAQGFVPRDRLLAGLREARSR